MNIIVGKNAGFCFGVKRAVEGSLKEITNNKKIYCLGELVHNKEVINKLQEKGIIFIDDINEIKSDNAKLIIRAHGVEQKVYKDIRNKKIELIDFTCPFVAKIHKIADDYQKKGYYIFLIGNRKHPEIIGTSSHCGNNYSIIENEDDLTNELNILKKKIIKNLLVIVQTTYSKDKYAVIEKNIREKIDSNVNLVIKNTICNATSERQDETKEIAKKVDLMIIIGGKNSSNTRKLFEIASKYTNSLIIETADEINLNDIKGYRNIGIMAGASTPKESIDELIRKLNNNLLTKNVDNFLS